MKKRKIWMIAAVCAVLMSVLAVFGTAKVREYLAMSPEHREFIQQEAQKAVKAGENDVQIASIKAATGGFSDAYDVVIDDEPYKELHETFRNGGYVFELQNIRRGKTVRMRGNGASPMSEEYAMREQIEDGLFVIVKVTKEDGTDLSDYFMAGAVISGQQPAWSLMCMYNYVCDYTEDGALYLAYDLTNALPFADRDIYLALYDPIRPTELGEEMQYMLQSTKNGIVSFHPDYTAPHALFKLTLPSSLADRAAQEAFLKEHEGIDKLK